MSTIQRPSHLLPVHLAYMRVMVRIFSSSNNQTRPRPLRLAPNPFFHHRIMLQAPMADEHQILHPTRLDLFTQHTSLLPYATRGMHHLLL